MKSTALLLFFAFFSVAVLAQNGIGFQGIARDPQGNAIAGQTITVKFTIGTFTETQNITTDNFGVFSATIGSVNTTGFNSLVFANISDNLKVEVDGTTIYDDKFNTVPFAKAAENGVPAGAIMPFGGPISNIPVGWLYCDGASYASTGMYGQLYNSIGYSWGNDGGKFRVPDLRGYFLRGVADGTAIDPDRASRTAKYAGGNSGDNVGSYQADSYASHSHSGTTSTDGNHSHSIGTRGYLTSVAAAGQGYSNGADGSFDDTGVTTYSAGSHSHTLNINANGGNETRSKNANVIFIIKY